MVGSLAHSFGGFDVYRGARGGGAVGWGGRVTI